MIRLALIAIGGIALTGCVSTSSTQWADQRCAEVAPNYDRQACIAAYVEARAEAKDQARMARLNLEDEIEMGLLRRDDNDSPYNRATGASRPF